MSIPIRDRTNKKPASVYTPMQLVHIYRLARLGFNDKEIAETIGIHPKTLLLWKRYKPDVVEALALARNPLQELEGEVGGTWKRFVYSRLTDDMKALWDSIEAWSKLPNGVAKIEAVLETQGKQVRQQLFMHALVHTNFSVNQALTKVNISKSTLDEWIREDPDFSELIEQIEWHKGNFFEESLLTLVGRGDTAATVFANKTFNKNRGYSPSTELNVRHSGQIEHNVLDLDDLELSHGCRLEIMQALRNRDEKKQLEKRQQLVPIEVRVLSDLSEEIASQSA